MCTRRLGPENEMKEARKARVAPEFGTGQGAGGRGGGRGGDPGSEPSLSFTKQGTRYFMKFLTSLFSSKQCRG